MGQWDKLCPGCFAADKTTRVCSRCGFDEYERPSPLVLKPRTLLNNQYVAGRILGKIGGFGITYLGWDTRLQTRVAIKEYLPRDLACRDADRNTVVPYSEEDGELFRYGFEQFIEEARVLARFDHFNIVRVRNFFEENGTAYLVMDYYEGMTLSEYLRSKGGCIPEKLAVEIMMRVLDGLKEVHAGGFLHRDIKPHNIYLAQGGRPILLDFGAARFAVGERTRSLSVLLTPGFAPPEQYLRKGNQGPWTDIYACGATLFHAITGVIPPESLDRMAEDTLQPPSELGFKLPPHLEAALMKALKLETPDRFQSVHEFQEALSPEVAKEKRPGREPPPANPFLSEDDPPDASPSADISRPDQKEPPQADPGLSTATNINIVFVMGVLVLIAFVGVVWSFYSNSFRKVPLMPVSGVQQASTRPPSATASVGTPSLKVLDSSIQAFFAQNVHVGQILVIEGEVENLSAGPVSYIQLEGKLFTSNNRVAITQKCYAGNPFTREELAQLNITEIQNQMNCRDGKDLANVRIAPGRRVPLTLVFHNLPELKTLNHYALEVVSSTLD